MSPKTRSAGCTLTALIVLACSFLAFGVSLRHDFVWDDVDALSTLGPPHAVVELPALFLRNIWTSASGGYFRPLIGFITDFVRAFAGEGPAGFHAVNILCHGLVAVLAFLVLNRMLDTNDGQDDLSRSMVAGAGAILFSVHPVHSESVAWASGITDPAYSLFFLLGLWSFQTYRDGGSRKYLFYSITAACCVLSPLAKEPGVTLPAVLLAYDLAFSPKQELRTLLRRHLPLFGATGVYFFLRMHALSGLNLGGSHQGMNLEQGSGVEGFAYIINIFPLFARYLKTLVFPFGLSSYYPPEPIWTLLSAKGIFGITVTATYLFLLHFTWRRSKKTTFALLFMVIPLLPALHFRATGTTTFADRYLYLPSFGLAVLLAFGAREAIRQKPRLATGIATGIAASFAIVITAWSTVTVSRTLVWENNLTLWSDVVGRYPDSSVARYNLAHELKRRGQKDAAIREYREAIRLNPRLPDAHMNLGNLYASSGMFTAALTEYHATLALKPDYAEAYYNIGRALLDAGRPGDAVLYLQKCLAIAPSHGSAQRVLEAVRLPAIGG